MIADPQEDVAGVLLAGMSDTARRIFDFFEEVEQTDDPDTAIGEMYRRFRARVRTLAGDSEAYAYAWLHPDRMTHEPWIPEEFRTSMLDAYMNDVVVPARREWEQMQS